jgi:RHS repeat-associated protein
LHNIITTKNYIWIGSEIAEERDTNNNITTVGKRFFPQGEQQLVNGTLTPFYYTRDHLGSVRELMNSSGTLYTRYTYDPYGRTTPAYGSANTSTPPVDATKQYAGYYAHQTSGLYLTKYRAYDSNTGRWLSRDPIAERGGINLYGYVGENPIDRIDRLGLSFTIIFSPGSNDSNETVNIIYHNDTGCPCKNIRFKQSVSMTSPNEPSTVKLDDKPTPKNPASPGIKSPYYPYQDTRSNGEQEMNDMPGYDDPQPSGIGFDYLFITCAYCTDTGKDVLLECLTWSLNKNSTGMHHSPGTNEHHIIPPIFAM